MAPRSERLAFVCGNQLGGKYPRDYAPQPDTSAGFFTSLEWFNPYFKLWSADCYGAIPACGAYFGATRKRGKLGNTYLAIAMNESLNPLHESLTLEANGLIGRASAEFREIFPEILASLIAQPRWKELRLAALTSHQADIVQSSAHASGLYCLVYGETKSFQYVYPKASAAQNMEFLSTLSANTRQQLKRAKRLLESKHGEATVDEPVSIDQAIKWLHELGLLHAKRWPSANPNEGFNNSSFVAFHQGMIRTLFSPGGVRILRLRAGSKDLAYLFFYQCKGTYSFLMSGVDYEDTAAFKPGMLAHWLAIEKFQLEGAVVYDFLNGENRYKESLSNQSYTVKTLLLRRRTPWFRLEHVLRAIRSRLNK